MKRRLAVFFAAALVSVFGAAACNAGGEEGQQAQQEATQAEQQLEQQQQQIEELQRDVEQIPQVGGNQGVLEEEQQKSGGDQ